LHFSNNKIETLNLWGAAEIKSKEIGGGRTNCTTIVASLQHATAQGMQRLV
jgi:hypothetical protein